MAKSPPIPGLIREDGLTADIDAAPASIRDEPVPPVPVRNPLLAQRPRRKNEIAEQISHLRRGLDPTVGGLAPSRAAAKTSARFLRAEARNLCDLIYSAISALTRLRGLAGFRRVRPWKINKLYQPPLSSTLAGEESEVINRTRSITEFARSFTEPEAGPTFASDPSWMPSRVPAEGNSMPEAAILWRHPTP
jgi:hypothetical protein